MAQPSDINNGDIPSATVLMTWLDWLNEGHGIKKGTYAALQAIATGAPTDLFMGWATDDVKLVLYTGDTAIGEDGFIVLWPQ